MNDMCKPATMHRGPVLSVHIAGGWESEPIEFENTPEDMAELNELIHELIEGAQWLEHQDPNEREYGPPEPPDALTQAIWGAYSAMALDWVKNSATVTKDTGVRFYFANELDNGQEARK